MTVVSIEKDFEALTMKLVAEFDASVDRVWQLWKDPRQRGDRRPTRRPSRSTTFGWEGDPPNT